MTDTLQKLAAQKIPGYANRDAVKFAGTSDSEALHDMYMMTKVESEINTVGRIPPIRDYVSVPALGCHSAVVLEPEVYGSQMRFERMTGKLRAHTRFSHATEDAAFFRMDSAAVPEMWAEITITKEELEEALNELNALKAE